MAKTKGKIRPPKAKVGAILAYIITSLAFFGTGIFCIVLLFQQYGIDIETFFNDVFLPAIVGTGATLANYWWVILVIVLGLLILGFLVGWLLLVLVAKFGDILVYAGCILTIVSGLIGGIVLGFLGLWNMALPALISAGLMIFAFATSMRKIRRAGQFMKFTGEVILAEKGMIIAPLFVSFVSVLNGLNMVAIFAELVLIFNGTDLQWLGYVLGSVASLVQMVVYYGMFYVAEAINTTFAYEWYRKRDPTMGFCIKNVAGNFGAIYTFGIVTALVTWLQKVLRNIAANTQKNAAGVIIAIIARIIANIMGFIYKYLTYFALPAIVVEGKSFKEGVQRSFDLLKRYYMDVLIRETGVSRSMGIVQFLAFIIYAAVGAILGAILYAVPSITVSLATAMLVTIIPAVIFAFIPTFFIFRPMKTAYLTFIFAYAHDEEARFKLPTRMPKELQGGLKDARKKMDTDKSIVNLKY